MSQSPANLVEEHAAETAVPGRTVAALDYGRGRGARRLRLRHAILGALIVAGTAGAWGTGRVARARAQTLLYERQAARHVESRDTVVFEADAEQAKHLLEAGQHVSLGQERAWPTARPDPAAFAALRGALDRDSLDVVGAMVFLHELRTPGGLRRIVAVRFLPQWLDGRQMPGAGLVAHIFEPAGYLGQPRHLGNSTARLLTPLDEVPSFGEVAFDPLAHAAPGLHSPTMRQVFDPHAPGTTDLRWFAGQPDATDPSHFTIDFERDGVRQTVDGYLTDDGRHVRLHTRPLAAPDDDGPHRVDISLHDDSLR